MNDEAVQVMNDDEGPDVASESGGVACFLTDASYREVIQLLGSMKPAGAATIRVWGDHTDQRFPWSEDGLRSAVAVPVIRRVDILDGDGDELVASGLDDDMLYLRFFTSTDDSVRGLHLMADHPAFTFGALVGGADLLQQDMRDIRSSFEQSGASLPQLPDPTEADAGDSDASTDVGRSFDTFGARLWAGSQMWFGPAFDQAVPMDRVRSLPTGEVSDLFGGGVHVRLFEFSDSEPTVRARQREAVDWLGFRGLEERTDSMRASSQRRRVID